jgi:hypothetical protein
LPEENLTNPGDPESYPYDGGPKNPVPNPEAEEGIDQDPRVLTIPDNGRTISIKANPKGKWAYPAYGEKARRIKPKQPDVWTIKTVAAG